MVSMAFNCSTSNINCTQGIGEGIMNIIRGGVQFAVESVDRALGTSYGAVDLAAVGVLLIVIGFVALKLRQAWGNAQQLF